MKHLKTLKQFSINEENLSKEFLKFEPGDTIVMKKTIPLMDFDFKKSARTWWGRKISSVLNLVVKGDEYNKNRKLSTGDVLFIFTKPCTIDSSGRANITGFGGFYEGTLSGMDPNKFTMSSFESTYNYDDAMVQLMILSVVEGYTETIKYDELSEDKKIIIESGIKMDRIKDNIFKNGGVIFKDMEVTEYEYTKQDKYLFKGFDKNTGDKLPDRLVRRTELSEETVLSLTGEEITGYPFKK